MVSRDELEEQLKACTAELAQAKETADLYLDLMSHDIVIYTMESRSANQRHQRLRPIPG